MEDFWRSVSDKADIFWSLGFLCLMFVMVSIFSHTQDWNWAIFEAAPTWFALIVGVGLIQFSREITKKNELLASSEPPKTVPATATKTAPTTVAKRNAKSVGPDVSDDRAVIDDDTADIITYVAADYLINHDRDDNDWDGDGSDSSDGDET
ncbi:hypothetical protein [Weissella soli]|uniref:hypothetical protein n=1 Tax=Weissella soli TaxID=155866 RepID=UPI0011BB8E52|nr:hypothetical protein [Weissella soli]QEA34680.1 hypothetical protein FGL88_02470 [Weissella soli]